jgi:hypothetical protein
MAAPRPSSYKQKEKFAPGIREIDQGLRNFAQPISADKRKHQRPAAISRTRNGCLGAAAVPLADTKNDELVFVEGRRNTRIIVSVPGTYILADHRNARGERRTYPCRAVNLSPETIALAAPVNGHLGERAFVSIDRLGKFKGSIIRLLAGGFVMSIVANDEERNKLAAKIDWFEQFKNFDVTDQRAEARFVPENPRSRIVFADGHSEECFILDLSASGAAISAQTIPEIGSVLALATIVARVVRHFDGGFALCFVERQDVQRLEARVNLDATGYTLD